MARRKARPFSPQEDRVIERARVRGLGPTAIARLLRQLYRTDRSPASINMRLKTLAKQDERQDGVRRRAKRIDWTDEMIDALQSLRARGTPLFICAERIGVSYPTCVFKAREIGVAERKSRGALSAAKVIAQQAAA